MLTATRRQRGGTLAGLLVGIVIGLGIALVTAMFVTQTSVPFIGAKPADSRAQGRSADKPAAPTSAAGAMPDPNQSAAARTTPKQVPPGLERGPIASVTVEAPTEAAPPPPPPSVGSGRPLPPPGNGPGQLPPGATGPGPAQPPASQTGGPVAGGPTQPVPMPPPNRADPRSPAAAGQAAGQRPESPGPVATAEPQTTYLLQAGAYRQSAEAESMKAKLALMGFEAQIVSADVNGSTLHRVRVGPYGGLDAMNRARSRLAENGIEATVLRQR